MKHYGDVTKINGAEVPVVDVVCGGSPCQDLSVAGKRAGLAGERSGLFMEQIRVIKEMREHDKASGRADEPVRCRYMVWENVPGALSSGTPKGEDFRIVLEETARVADENAVIPGPPKGKWQPAGCILGDGWSIAWRVHDAQFWGVPQRRKRIALVADFGGHTAPEILFEREGVSRDIEESGKAGETVAGNAGNSVAQASAFTIKIRGGADTYIKSDGSIGTAGKGPLVQTELSGTLGVSQDQTLIQMKGGVNILNPSDSQGNQVADADGIYPALRGCGGAGYQQGYLLDHQEPVVYGISSYDSNGMKSDNPNAGIYEAETARTLDNNGGNPGCNQGGMAVVCGNPWDPQSERVFYGDGAWHSLQSGSGGGQSRDAVLSVSAKQQSIATQTEVAASLGANDYKEPQVVCIEGNGSRPSHKGDGYAESETMYTLNSTENHAVAYQKQGHPHNAEEGQGWEEANVNATLNAFENGENRASTIIVENHPQDSRVKVREDGICQTLDARMGMGGGNVPMVMEPPMCIGNGQVNQAQSDKVGALNCMHDQQAVMYAAVDCRNGTENAEINGTLQAKEQGYNTNSNNICRTGYVVRRLTPLEEERLQGFPDHWTDIGEWVDSKGKTHKDADSPRYKALGNSIALPFWQWMAERICKQYDRPVTMASLFDGISGFCLVFARAGCKPVFSSEIEEFPIAVAKKHFGDDDTGEVGDYEQYL